MSGPYEFRVRPRPILPNRRNGTRRECKLQEEDEKTRYLPKLYRTIALPPSPSLSPRASSSVSFSSVFGGKRVSSMRQVAPLFRGPQRLVPMEDPTNTITSLSLHRKKMAEYEIKCRERETYQPFGSTKRVCSLSSPSSSSFSPCGAAMPLGSQRRCEVGAARPRPRTEYCPPKPVRSTSSLFSTSPTRLASQDNVDIGGGRGRGGVLSSSLSSSSSSPIPPVATDSDERGRQYDVRGCMTVCSSCSSTPRDKPHEIDSTPSSSPKATILHSSLSCPAVYPSEPYTRDNALTPYGMRLCSTFARVPSIFFFVLFGQATAFFPFFKINFLSFVF